MIAGRTIGVPALGQLSPAAMACVLAMVLVTACSEGGSAAGDSELATKALTPSDTTAEVAAAAALSLASTGALEAQDDISRARDCSISIGRAITVLGEAGVVGERELVAMRQGRDIYLGRLQQLTGEEAQIEDGEGAQPSDGTALRTSLACLNALVEEQREGAS